MKSLSNYIKDSIKTGTQLYFVGTIKNCVACGTEGAGASGIARKNN